MKPTLIPICLAIALLPVGTMQSRADWSGLASPGFSYCYCLDPCTDFLEQWLLAPGDDCELICEAIGENPGYPCGVGGIGTVNAYTDWKIIGEDRSYGIEPFRVELQAMGQRTGIGTFLVEGTKSIHGVGTVEVAVFRFAGDPSVFDGLGPSSVLDLVDWGVIALDDVLLVKQTSEIGDSFSFEVDVAGVADEEIVMMTTGDGITGMPVPAADPRAVAVLVLLVLTLGTLAVLKRRDGAVR
jgi:hypothetical protein